MITVIIIILVHQKQQQNKIKSYIIPTTIEQSLPITIQKKPITFGLVSVRIYNIINKYHHQSKHMIFQKFVFVAVSSIISIK